MFLTTIHPHTNEVINLFSDKVNNLLDNGYTIIDIMNLFKSTPPKYNRNNIFTNDILMNYAMHLNLVDIISLCSVDKHARIVLDNKLLWKCKIEQCTTYNIYDYTALNYKKVLYTQKIINIYCGSNVTFKFKPEDDLSEIINNSKYTPGVNGRQQIDIYSYIKYNNYYIVMRVMRVNSKYSEKIFKLEDKLSICDIKKFMFNVIFKFPNALGIKK